MSGSLASALRPFRIALLVPLLSLLFTSCG